MTSCSRSVVQSLAKSLKRQYTRPLVVSLLLVLMLSGPAWGQLMMRVVDVGAGLCCVVETSDGHYMIYDAGNYKDHGETAMTAIQQMIPFDSTIDLLVLSHCDADHLAAVPFICENYHVKEVWRDGLPRDTGTWERADEWIGDEVIHDGCDDVNLQLTAVEPGYSVDIGNAAVTFLCGFADIPGDWPSLSSGENRNARSIVVRLDYSSSSILFTGDTVGRHIGDSWNTCIAAEKELVDNADEVPLVADVIVAPHHGADNGSSYPFVQAVSPEYVIFSAGHDYHHPHFWSANRYIASGVSPGKMFRTDLGDNEGSYEWRIGSGDEADSAGDDDVLVTLSESGNVEVEYVPPLGLFETRTFTRNGLDREVVVKVRSRAVAKWVEDDSLWTDEYDDLEDHTIPPASMIPAEAGFTRRSCCPRRKPVCCPRILRKCRIRRR